MGLALRTTGIWILAVWTLAVLLCGTSQAGKSMTLAVDDDFPPFSFSENGVPAGIDVDIARELGERIGIEFKISLMPWKRLLAKTRKGEIDAAMSLFKTRERETFAIFTHPIHYSTFVLFVKKGREFQYTTISDLYGKRILIEAGFSAGEAFDRAVSENKINAQEVFQPSGVFHFLVNGSYDAFVNNREVTLYRLRHKQNFKKYADQITFLPRPVKHQNGAFFVLSKQGAVKNKAGLAQKITAHLREMEAQGRYTAITGRYISGQ